ncbi:hypothetical protein [Streptomyces sp. NPDC001927]
MVGPEKESEDDDDVPPWKTVNVFSVADLNSWRSELVVAVSERLGGRRSAEEALDAVLAVIAGDEVADEVRTVKQAEPEWSERLASRRGASAKKAATGKKAAASKKATTGKKAAASKKAAKKVAEGKTAAKKASAGRAASARESISEENSASKRERSKR